MQYKGVCSLSIRFRKIYVTFSRFCFLRLEPPYTRSLRAHSSLSAHVMFFLAFMFSSLWDFEFTQPSKSARFSEPLNIFSRDRPPYTTSLRAHSSLSVRVLKFLFLAFIFQISVILSSLILDLL